jgi:hypothetical protein
MFCPLLLINHHSSFCVIPSSSLYVIKCHVVSCDGLQKMHFCSLHSCHPLSLKFSISTHMKSLCITTTLRISYRASQKDVPEFNNLLLDFNTSQVNRISIDGMENSPILFQAHYKYSIFAPPVTRHTSNR